MQIMLTLLAWIEKGCFVLLLHLPIDAETHHIRVGKWPPGELK